MNGDVFNGDLAQRYQDEREPERYSWRQAEEDYGRDIFERPEETVAGLAWNFKQTHVDPVKAYLSQGKFAEAKRSYDYLVKDVMMNWEGLGTQSELTDDYGKLSGELGKRSQYAYFGGFNDEEVKLPDGTVVKLGQALADGSQFLEGKVDELKDFGLGSRAAELYMQGDRAMKSVIDPLLAAKRGRAGEVPNRIQLIELAEDYANNYDRVVSVFADGTQRFMDFLQETHKTAGSGAKTFRTLLSFAEDYAAKTGVTGKQLASDIVGGYNELVAAVFQGDPQVDRNGVRRVAEITDDNRRLFDAAFLPAVTEALRGLDGQSSFNLRDPRLRTAMREIADVAAYAIANDVDLMSDARADAYDINGAFGSYVRNAMLGMRQTSDNIVEGVRKLRADMSARITGGRSPQSVMAGLTGQASDYMSSVDRRTGTQSFCPEADNMAADMHKFLVQEMVPAMARGQLVGNAVRDRAPELLEGLTARFARSFSGPGKDLAARLVARAALMGAVSSRGEVLSRGYLNGGQVNMEELISTLAFAPDADAADPAIRALRAWYDGNVVHELQFADRRARLRDSLKADGLSDEQARHLVSSTSSQAAKWIARGIDPAPVFDAAESVGPYLTLAPSADGKTVRVVRTYGNRDKASIPYDPRNLKTVLPPGTFLQNRGVFYQVQKGLTDKLRQQDLIDAYQRKLEVKENMDE